MGLGTFKPLYEENIAEQKLHFEPMLIDPQLWKLIADAKQAGKIFLPVGTTMIRYLESLPYIWRFLKKKNLISSLDPATQAWRNDLTKVISDDLVAEFIPEQEVEIQPSASLCSASPLNKEGQICSDGVKAGYFTIQTRLFIRP